MENKKVSVIVPIYNVERYLEKCLDSIIGQTHKNLEIILVDDGSTDKCGEICDKYASMDKRIKVIHQKNGGQSNARNRGLKIMHGDFVCFVDADDEIKKDFVKKLLGATKGDIRILAATGIEYRKLFQHTVSDVYVRNIRKQRAHESLEEYIPFLLSMDGRMYSVINKIFSAKMIKNNNLAFQEKIDFAEDTRFVLQYVKTARPEVSFVLEPLYIYNFGTETSTIKRTSVDWKNWKRSFGDLKQFVGKNPSIKSRFWMSVVLLRWRVSYVRSKLRFKRV